MTVISADVGHWVHPKGEHRQFLMVIDEGSRFKVARHVLTGKKTHITAAQFVTALKESWMGYFGTQSPSGLTPMEHFVAMNSANSAINTISGHYPRRSPLAFRYMMVHVNEAFSRLRVSWTSWHRTNLIIRLLICLLKQSGSLTLGNMFGVAAPSSM